MTTNEAKAFIEAVRTVRKALAGETFESAVKVYGGRIYDCARELCAEIVAVAEAVRTGGLGGGNGGSDISGIADAVEAHNTAAGQHQAQFSAAVAAMTALLATLTKTAPQTPSTAAGTVEYNHIIITPNADNTDVTLSVTHNANNDRLPYEILCYPVAGTLAAIPLTFTLKKIGDFWHIKSLNTFLYRNSSSLTGALVGIYAVNGLTGSAKAPVTNAVACYIVGQISGYPQLITEGTRTTLYFGPDVTNATGANLQNFFVNNTV